MSRSLSAEENVPTKKYGDNESVHESCTNDNACKSRHSTAFFHRMRESVAAEIIEPHRMCSEENITYVLTKTLGIELHKNLTNEVLK